MAKKNRLQSATQSSIQQRHTTAPSRCPRQSIGEVLIWSAMKFALAVILSRRTERMAARGRSRIRTQRKVTVFGADARCSSPRNFSRPRGKARDYLRLPREATERMKVARVL